MNHDQRAILYSTFVLLLLMCIYVPWEVTGGLISKETRTEYAPIWQDASSSYGEKHWDHYDRIDTDRFLLQFVALGAIAGVLFLASSKK